MYASAMRRDQGSLAVTTDVIDTLIGAIGGAILAVIALWGKFREISSREQVKRAETETANAQVYIGLGKDLIANLSAEVKELRDGHKANTERIISLHGDVGNYKLQCEELSDRVALQTLKIQEQDLKIQEQALQIREQTVVIEKQAAEIHTLRWEVARGAGHHNSEVIGGSEGTSI